MSTDRQEMEAWNDHFEQLKDYKKSHGDCNVPHCYPELGRWVGAQRVHHARKRLPKERQETLEGVGFLWNPNAKPSIPDSHHPESEGEGEGDSISQQQPSSPPTPICCPSKHQEAVWDVYFQQLLDYKHEHGDCNVPKKYDPNPPLGNWVTKQRRQQKKGQLSEAYEAKLNEIDFPWDEPQPSGKHNKSWNERFEELREYKQLYGDCNVPQTYHTNPTLGKWVIGQRHNRQKGQLSEERKEKLDSIGFIWSKKAMTDSQLWEFRFQQLVDYKSQHGDCNVPTQNDQNPQLGSWVGTQRAFRKNGRLSQERQDKLDAIGFDWKANRNKLKHTDWNLRFEQLCDFQKQHGHCNVPRVYDPNPQLGLWVGTQRAFKKQDRLTEKREARLNAIGFLWGPQNGHEKPKWTLRFEELEVFKKVHSHCNVPQRYSPNPQLGHWVMRQRNSYTKAIMSAERKDKLDSIGFVWNPARGS